MEEEKGFEEIVIEKFSEARDKLENHEKRLKELEENKSVHIEEKPVIVEKSLEEIQKDANPEEDKEVEKVEDIKRKSKKDFIDRILSIKIL
jgi:hypothetical protein